MQLKLPHVIDFPESVLQNIGNLCFTDWVVFPLSKDEPRRVMSQVSSKWRRIFISTPSYWSAIDLTPTHFHNMKNAINQAEAFIGRSGNLPVSLRFHMAVQDSGNQENLVVESMLAYYNVVRRVLILSDSRLQSLQCTMSETDAFKLFKSRSFPILDNINVTVIADPNVDHTHTSPQSGRFKFTGFQTAPILRKATLLFLIPFRPIELRLPWSHLTELHLGHSPIPVENFMWMMDNSRSLENASFHIGIDTPSNSNAPRHRSLRKVTMSNLRLLRLILLQPSKYPSIFGLLYLPALEEIWLERGELGMRRNMSIYRKLVSASRATLKRIILNEFVLGPTSAQSSASSPRRLVYKAVDGFFQFSQNITSLHLSTGVYLNPTTLEQLSTGKLLPLLEMLEVSTFNGWDIVSMVERRNTLSKHGISSSTSLGPQLQVCALAYLYLFVFAYDMDLRQRSYLEAAVAALDLADYRLGFA